MAPVTCVSGGRYVMPHQHSHAHVVSLQQIFLSIVYFSLSPIVEKNAVFTLWSNWYLFSGTARHFYHHLYHCHTLILKLAVTIYYEIFIFKSLLEYHSLLGICHYHLAQLFCMITQSVLLVLIIYIYFIEKYIYLYNLVLSYVEDIFKYFFIYLLRRSRR